MDSLMSNEITWLSSYLIVPSNIIFSLNVVTRDEWHVLLGLFNKNFSGPEAVFLTREDKIFSSLRIWK